MKKKITETQLTAYALGELDKEQAQIVKNAIQESPELQAELEGIQQMALFLENEMKNETLPESQGAEFLEPIKEKPKNVWMRPLFGLALAAGVAGLIWVNLQNKEPSILIASKDTMGTSPVPPISDGALSDASGVSAKSNNGVRSDMSMAESAPQSAGTKAVGKGDSNSPAHDALVKSESAALGGSVDSVRGIVTGSASGKGMGRPMAKKKLRAKVSEIRMGGVGERFRSYPKNFYGQIYKSSFLMANEEPLSTFSIDVDTASYSIVRRSLMEYNRMPSPESIRIEEMINYFDYDDPAPKGGEPFSVHWEVANSPWIDGNKLVRIAIKGKIPTLDEKKNSNLVFLVDVSGSMENADKLPLLKQGLHKLVDQLDRRDRISLVVYAGDSRVVLESTKASEKSRVHKAIDDLTASGGTNGSGGILKAYELARQGFIKGGVNRVILATDGDFNVGVTSPEALDTLIKDQAKSGVYLTILGFGNAFGSDAMMESLSNKGNGNYFLIDSQAEADKVLVKGVQGTLVTIAKDVKIQIEFNPENVKSYRLIGYENRRLKAQDFNNDKKDAGDIGAGHSVVALYELTTHEQYGAGVDALKYQKIPVKPTKKASGFGDQLLTLKLRYKEPDGKTSTKREFTLTNQSKGFQDASPNMRWSAGIAGFGMMLKNDQIKGDLTYGKVIDILDKSRWGDKKSYDSKKGELVEMVKKAKRLSE